MSATKLSTKDRLAMYRNAFYSLMGARETLPTDAQCLVWLKQVADQAQYKTDPAFAWKAYEPEIRLAGGVVPKVEIRRWDVVVPLPDWTKIPTEYDQQRDIEAEGQRAARPIRTAGERRGK